MTTDERFDGSISSWFEETAPTRLPERVLDATFERTRRSTQHVGWRTFPRRIHITRFGAALGSAAVVVVAAALALNFQPNPAGLGGSPTANPPSPFEGSWVSADADGSSLTMTVHAARDGAFEITVHDDAASVCSGAASTMTGTGRIVGTSLVIPTPMFTCDDGSEPAALSGPPLAEQLRDLTFVRDPRADTLTDTFGGVWWREGAEQSTPEPTVANFMWPQSSLDQVRRAQDLADSGDPAYTWQVDPQLSSDEWWAYLRQPGAEIVERFIREELGWDEFLFNSYVGDDGDGAADGVIRGVVYLRCAPGATNPLYPIPTGFDALGGDRCAPTIDEFRYESVSLDLSQLDRQGPDGIWVVSRWAMTAPFAQADPRVVEAQATEQLEDFLRARIEGEGAELYVEVSDAVDEIPLLYGTTSGASYERWELERVGAPVWPYGWMEFMVRLFADGGGTVVEQPISLRDARLHLAAAETTENGQPFAVAYSLFDGEVTFAAADPWQVRGGLTDWGALTMGEFWMSEEGIELVACEPGPAPGDAQALARSIQSGPGRVATAPADVRVGGADGLEMDVTIAAGMSVCGASFPSREVVTGLALADGIRMRLYLLDLPEGSATRVLVIAIAAPEARFDAVIEATAPIIESIEVHAP